MSTRQARPCVFGSMKNDALSHDTEAELQSLVHLSHAQMWAQKFCRCWCRQIHLTRHIFHVHCVSGCVHNHCMAQDEPSKCLQCAFHSIFTLSMMSVWALLALVLSFSCFSPSFTSSLPHSTWSLPGTHLQCRHRRGFNQNHCTHAQWGVLHHGDAQPSHKLWAQTPRQLRPLRDRLLQWSSRMNPATWIRSVRTRVMRNSTMRFSEKRYLHHCSFRSEKNQRTGDNLSLSWRKFVASSVLFQHISTGRPVYELSLSQKRKSSLEMEKRKKQDSLWKTKRANSRWL